MSHYTSGAKPAVEQLESRNLLSSAYLDAFLHNGILAVMNTTKDQQTATIEISQDGKQLSLKDKDMETVIDKLTREQIRQVILHGGDDHHGSVSYTLPKDQKPLTAFEANFPRMALAVEGVAAELGLPTSDVLQTGSVYFQRFEKGVVYQSAATGAHAILGSATTSWLGAYNSAGGQATLGLPTSDVKVQAGAVMNNEGQLVDLKWQDFQKGVIYQLPDGKFRVQVGTFRIQSKSGDYVLTPDGLFFVPAGPILSQWASRGYGGGPLGMPKGDVQTPGAGINYQQFSAGDIVTAGAESYVIPDPIRGVWEPLATSLGLPDSGVQNGDGGTRYQNFAGGGVILTSDQNATRMDHEIWYAWKKLGYEKGALGALASGVTTDGAGNKTVKFHNGTVVLSPDGTIDVNITSGPIRDYLGRNSTSLGPKTSEMVFDDNNDALYQAFQKGVVYYRPDTGVHAILGSIWGLFQQGGVDKFGLPTADVQSGDKDVQYQKFTKGVILLTADHQATLMPEAIQAAWANQKGEKGTLGVPAGGVTSVNDGTIQYQSVAFHGGTVFLPKGGNSAFVLSTGPIFDFWKAHGGPLGSATSNLVINGGTSYQEFQKGVVYYSKATGAHAILGGKTETSTFLGVFTEVGGVFKCGPPIGEKTVDNKGNSKQNFQLGTITQTGNDKPVFNPGRPPIPM